LLIGAISHRDRSARTKGSRDFSDWHHAAALSTVSPQPYAGRQVALATRHGKERVLARPLRWGLGATLLHLTEVDTDQLGSFCGSVARRGSPRQACQAKATLALEQSGCDLAIASEGSFGPHPAVPLLAVGMECLVFLDAARGLTVVEEGMAPRTNFSHHRLDRRRLAALLAAAPATPTGALADSFDGELERWLSQVGFPSHGLLVRPLAPGLPPGTLRKGIHQRQALATALRWAADRGSEGAIQLETDMRAHCNPTRMASIRQLAFRLVRRLRTPCPACGAPGWGTVAREAGLPCAWCHQPTSLLRGERLGCGACGHHRLLPRRDGLTQADPGHCPHCNP